MYVLDPHVCPQGMHSAQCAHSACAWHDCRTFQTSCCMSSQIRTTLGTIGSLRQIMLRTDWQSVLS